MRAADLQDSKTAASYYKNQAEDDDEGGEEEEQIRRPCYEEENEQTQRLAKKVIDTKKLPQIKLEKPADLDEESMDSDELFGPLPAPKRLASRRETQDANHEDVPSLRRNDSIYGEPNR